MKKLIFFKGGIETLEFFSIQLCEIFNNLGYETFIFDLQEQFDSFNSLISFCKKGEGILITFNFIGLSCESVFNRDEKLFFDEYEIQCMNILVDHPFYYHNNLRNLPKNYIQFNIDRTHISYMQRFFKNVRLGDYFPLAGTSSNKVKRHGVPKIHERNIGILFAGNYTSPEKFKKQITRINDDYTQFYYDIIDDLTANPDMTMDYAFEKHIISEIPTATDNDLIKCMENMIFIDLYVRFSIREKAVRLLVDNGFKVDVYGSGLDMAEYKHPENLIMHGSADSALCLRKLSDAKLSLNVMPWFKDGAHDRIFNAAMNGAVNLTDDSIYLHELFDDMNCISFYHLNNMEELPVIAEKLLNDEAELQRMADKAYSFVSEAHTWKNRAEILLKYF